MRIKWKTVAKIIAIILCIYLCIHYWPGISELMSKIRTASAPIIVGIIVAYAVNILMSFYEKFYFPNSKKKAVIKTRRPICMLSALITLLGIIALIIGLVAPQLIECIETLISKIPAAIDYTLPKLQKILVKLQDKGIVPDNITDSI
ncbi:MAG: AI-2E family transporter, partial [Acutalibacteraceae bacterium]|nr:AI-2E family transporter [Acutalibacteraceae bacterium]